jgi:hypothetical protein
MAKAETLCSRLQRDCVIPKSIHPDSIRFERPRDGRGPNAAGSGAEQHSSTLGNRCSGCENIVYKQNCAIPHRTGVAHHKSSPKILAALVPGEPGLRHRLALARQDTRVEAEPRWSRLPLQSSARDQLGLIEAPLAQFAAMQRHGHHNPIDFANRGKLRNSCAELPAKKTCRRKHAVIFQQVNSFAQSIFETAVGDSPRVRGRGAAAQPAGLFDSAAFTLAERKSENALAAHRAQASLNGSYGIPAILANRQARRLQERLRANAAIRGEQKGESVVSHRA